MEFRSLILALEKNPKAKGSELPQDEAQAWLGNLNKAIGMEVALDHDKCFISEVIRNIQKSDCAVQISNWDPFEPDYGNGPSDFLDRWRKGKVLTNGLFNGSVFIDEKPFDRLSAELLSLFGEHVTLVLAEDDIPLLLKHSKEWVSPRSIIEREAAIVSEIVVKVSKLSPESRRNLCEQINKIKEE